MVISPRIHPTPWCTVYLNAVCQVVYLSSRSFTVNVSHLIRTPSRPSVYFNTVIWYKVMDSKHTGVKFRETEFDSRSSRIRGLAVLFRSSLVSSLRIIFDLNAVAHHPDSLYLALLYAYSRPPSTKPAPYLHCKGVCTIIANWVVNSKRHYFLSYNVDTSQIKRLQPVLQNALAKTSKMPQHNPCMFSITSLAKSQRERPLQNFVLCI